MKGDFAGARQFAWFVPADEQHKKGKFHRGSKPMKSWAQLLAARKHHWAHNCYQSVYEFDEWKGNRPLATSARLDRIFFDFDDEDNPQRAIDDAAKMADKNTTQWFSGMKGIGMLLHIPTTDIHPSMKAAVLKRTSKAIIENLGITTADTAVIGDLNRVHRMTNSRHQVTGLYAIPLHQSELSVLSIDGIKKMAKKPRDLFTTQPEPSGIVADYMTSIERTIINGRMDVLIGKNMLSRQFYGEHHMVRPEEKVSIIETIQRLETEARRIEAKNAPRVDETNRWLVDAREKLLIDGQLTDGKDRGEEHKARVHFCKYAHECGWTFRQICGTFVNLVDRHGKHCYDARMTEQQVRSCIGR